MFKKIKKVMEFIKERKEMLIVIGWFLFIMSLAVLLA
jgi:hypothetical protein